MAFVRKCPALVALAACGTCLARLHPQDMLEIPNGTCTSCNGTYCLHIPLLPLVNVSANGQLWFLLARFTTLKSIKEAD